VVIFSAYAQNSILDFVPYWRQHLLAHGRAQTALVSVAATLLQTLRRASAAVNSLQWPCARLTDIDFSQWWITHDN